MNDADIRPARRWHMKKSIIAVLVAINSSALAADSHEGVAGVLKTWGVPQYEPSQRRVDIRQRE